MTIDEAMKKIKEKMACDYNISGCDTCDISGCEDRDIIIQLAEWLEELKDYRDKNKMVVRVDVENMDSIKDKIDELSKYAESQYNKALDDFVNFASTLQTVEEEDWTIRHMWLEEMAEKLKAGAKNDGE